MKPKALPLLSTLAFAAFGAISSPTFAAFHCAGVFGVSPYKWSEIEVELPLVNVVNAKARWNEASGSLVLRDPKTDVTIAIFMRKGNEVQEVKRDSDYVHYKINADSIGKLMRTREELEIDENPPQEFRYDTIKTTRSNYVFRSKVDTLNKTLYVLGPNDKVMAIYAKKGKEIVEVQGFENGNIADPHALMRLLYVRPIINNPLKVTLLPVTPPAYVYGGVEALTFGGLFMVKYRYKLDPDNGVLYILSDNRVVSVYVEKGSAILTMKKGDELSLEAVSGLMSMQR